jgi:prepilin-type N-terminal cleavage/methylation domain-containing protein
MTPRNNGSRGFTLVELMVTLAISGILLVTARVMIEELADSADRIRSSVDDLDYTANAERVLRELAGRTQSATIRSHAVAGDAATVRLATACDTPGGWLEECEVGFGIVTIADEMALALTLPGDTIILRRGFTTGRLLYLADAGAGGKWLPAWNSAITTPVAIGVALDADTLILRIGERG